MLDARCRKVALYIPNSSFSDAILRPLSASSVVMVKEETFRY